MEDSLCVDGVESAYCDKWSRTRNAEWIESAPVGIKNKLEFDTERKRRRRNGTLSCGGRHCVYVGRVAGEVTMGLWVTIDFELAVEGYGSLLEETDCKWTGVYSWLMLTLYEARLEGYGLLKS